MKKGTIIISIDFELLWGLTDSNPSESVYVRLRKVTEVVDKILALFGKYEIHATWAIVGSITYTGLKELKNALNLKDNNKFSVNSNYALLLKEMIPNDDNILFTPQSISSIQNITGQEIQNHSFLHIYSNQTNEELFKYDLNRSHIRFKELNLPTPNFYVFPRNNYTFSRLKILSKNGYKSFRGYDSFLYTSNNYFIRIIRRFESLFPVEFRRSKLIFHKGLNMYEFKLSRFLRTFSRPNSIPSKLHYKKIRNGIDNAIKHGGLYHLWFHPHNFTLNDDNLKKFERLLKYIQQNIKDNRIESLTVNEYLLSKKL